MPNTKRHPPERLLVTKVFKLVVENNFKNLHLNNMGFNIDGNYLRDLEYTLNTHHSTTINNIIIKVITDLQI